MAVESITDKLNRLVHDLRVARQQVAMRSAETYLGVGATVCLPKDNERRICMYATDRRDSMELLLFEAGQEALATRIRYHYAAKHRVVRHTKVSGSLTLTALQDSREFYRKTLAFKASSVPSAYVSRDEMTFIDDCLRHAISVAATYHPAATSWRITPQPTVRLPVRDFNKRLPNHSNAFKLWLNYRDPALPPEQKMLMTGLPYSVHHIKGGNYEDGVYVSLVGNARDLTNTALYPKGPLLRIHSACCFSEQGRSKGYVVNLEQDAAHAVALHSAQYAFVPYEATPSESCDCRLQMEESQRQIAQYGGIFADFYEQEGRGYGLLNKEEFFYRLNEEEGWDTAEVCERYGINPDIRVYKNFAAWLTSLGIRQVQLLGNNPRKQQALEQAGITVHRVTLWKPTPGNISYLKVKRDKLRHHLPTDEELKKLAYEDG